MHHDHHAFIYFIWISSIYVLIMCWSWVYSGFTYQSLDWFWMVSECVHVKNGKSLMLQRIGKSRVSASKLNRFFQQVWWSEEIPWLVGGWATPLKSINQLGWLFPTHGKTDMFQTTNQLISILKHWCHTSPPLWKNWTHDGKFQTSWTDWMLMSVDVSFLGTCWSNVWQQRSFFSTGKPWYTCNIFKHILGNIHNVLILDLGWRMVNYSYWKMFGHKLHAWKKNRPVTCNFASQIPQWIKHLQETIGNHGFTSQFRSVLACKASLHPILR